MTDDCNANTALDQLAPDAVACDDDINSLLQRISSLEFERLISDVRATCDGLRINRLIGEIAPGSLSVEAVAA
jgi:hypothetical protein